MKTKKLMDESIKNIGLKIGEKLFCIESFFQNLTVDSTFEYRSNFFIENR